MTPLRLSELCNLFERAGLPARLEGEHGETTVDPVKWQGSGDLVAPARSNCFLVATPEQDSWAAGEWIDVLPQ